MDILGYGNSLQTRRQNLGLHITAGLPLGVASDVRVCSSDPETQGFILTLFGHVENTHRDISSAWMFIQKTEIKMTLC